MLFCTLIGVILLISKRSKKKNSCPVNTLVGHKFTISRLPRGWTGPSKTSIWNTSPLKMLFYTLIGVIILNSKRVQNHKKSCPRKHPSWTQVYNLCIPKGLPAFSNWRTKRVPTKVYTYAVSFWLGPSICVEFIYCIDRQVFFSCQFPSHRHVWLTQWYCMMPTLVLYDILLLA